MYLKSMIPGYRALNHISLDVFPAEIIALLGSNGAGKTTVWHTVNFSRGLFGKKKKRAYLKRFLQDLSLWDKKYRN